MRKITEEELNRILENHKHWLARDCDGWEKMRADLSNTDLTYAYLKCANLHGADLKGANLHDADLRYAILKEANLKGVNLRGANLGQADLSGAKNLLSPIDYLKENFEFTKDGVIAYKIFGSERNSPENWIIQSGSIITENCDSNRADACGCGINVATLEWIRNRYEGKIWKLLIRWEWLVGVVVPYNSDGKIRCERAELIEIVETKEG